MMDAGSCSLSRPLARVSSGTPYPRWRKAQAEAIRQVKADGLKALAFLLAGINPKKRLDFTPGGCYTSVDDTNLLRCSEKISWQNAKRIGVFAKPVKALGCLPRPMLFSWIVIGR
jgi:hypothetical protein